MSARAAQRPPQGEEARVTRDGAPPAGAAAGARGAGVRSDCWVEVRPTPDGAPGVEVSSRVEAMYGPSIRALVRLHAGGPGRDRSLRDPPGQRGAALHAGGAPRSGRAPPAPRRGARRPPRRAPRRPLSPPAGPPAPLAPLPAGQHPPPVRQRRAARPGRRGAGPGGLRAPGGEGRRPPAGARRPAGRLLLWRGEDGAHQPAPDRPGGRARPWPPTGRTPSCWPRPSGRRRSRRCTRWCRALRRDGLVGRPDRAGPHPGERPGRAGGPGHRRRRRAWWRWPSGWRTTSRTSAPSARAGGREGLWALSQVVNAARAAGVQPLGSVYSDVDDADGLRAWAQRGPGAGLRRRGLHPPPAGAGGARGVRALGGGGAAGRADRGCAIEAAPAAGQGVVAVDGAMVDAPVAARAARTLRLAQVAGRGRRRAPVPGAPVQRGGAAMSLVQNAAGRLVPDHRQRPAGHPVPGRRGLPAPGAQGRPAPHHLRRLPGRRRQAGAGPGRGPGAGRPAGRDGALDAPPLPGRRPPHGAGLRRRRRAGRARPGVVPLGRLPLPRRPDPAPAETASMHHVEGSLNGPLGDYASQGLMRGLAVLRSHGGTLPRHPGRRRAGGPGGDRRPGGGRLRQLLRHARAPAPVARWASPCADAQYADHVDRRHRPPRALPLRPLGHPRRPGRPGGGAGRDRRPGPDRLRHDRRSPARPTAC